MSPVTACSLYDSLVTAYHGTNAVMTPKTHIVTDAPHIAFFRPNLSEIKPEQKEPSANPIKER